MIDHGLWHPFYSARFVDTPCWNWIAFHRFFTVELFFQKPRNVCQWNISKGNILLFFTDQKVNFMIITSAYYNYAYYNEQKVLKYHSLRNIFIFQMFCWRPAFLYAQRKEKRVFSCVVSCYVIPSFALIFLACSKVLRLSFTDNDFFPTANPCIFLLSRFIGC